MERDAFYEDAAQAIRDGADLNRKGRNGIALLHYWVSAGRADIVELLLSNGADVDIREDQGWTPLHFAAANGNLDLVRLLVDRGADVTARAAGRRSFLDRLLGRHPRLTPRAAADGHPEVVDFLAAREARS
jgi:ankyrin repeat protein